MNIHVSFGLAQACECLHSISTYDLSSPKVQLLSLVSFVHIRSRGCSTISRCKGRASTAGSNLSITGRRRRLGRIQGDMSEIKAGEGGRQATATKANEKP